MNSLIFLLLSYVLGSIPFGYIIAIISAKKNVLEIGWKKTSGSNVFKNVGKWQGIATILLDALKGYAAVYIAQSFGLDVIFQVLCGLMSIIGHNWSVFLKFKGGRGLGTLLGIMAAFSFKTLLISSIPIILFGLVWTASIGTIIFFIVGICVSYSLGYFESIGILLIMSSVPMAVKRLSPIKEALKDKTLFKNRILYDQDSVPGLKIKL